MTTPARLPLPDEGDWARADVARQRAAWKQRMAQESVGGFNPRHHETNRRPDVRREYTVVTEEHAKRVMERRMRDPVYRVLFEEARQEYERAMGEKRKRGRPKGSKNTKTTEQQAVRSRTGRKPR